MRHNINKFTTNNPTTQDKKYQPDAKNILKGLHATRGLAVGAQLAAQIVNARERPLTA